MTYRIRWNFKISQPTWTASKRATFGEGNEGFTLDAPDLETARRIVADLPSRGGYLLNPNLLTFTPEGQP